MANGTASIGPAVSRLEGASPRLNRLAFPVLRCGLVAAGLGVLLSYVVLAVAHINDRFQINFCSSIYATLALYVNSGRFYPDLYDGAHFAGTRYMPLEFVLHAGLARLTGEYLISGKLLAYSLTAVLGGQLWLILRRLDCPRGVAVAAISFLVLTEAGYLACTTIRGDLLPVVCQMAALLIVAAEPTRGRTAGAGVCCTLAVLAKFSAVWAPLAITAYLLLRHRRFLAHFVAATGVSLVVGILGCHWLSDGRMHANFAALSLAGVTPTDVALAPVVLLWKVGRSGMAVAFLVPAFVVELVAAGIQRRNTLFHYAAYACLGVTALVYTDRGSDSNHLVDMMALAIVLCGSLWGGLPSLRGPAGSMHCVLGLCMLWVLFAAWINMLAFPVLNALRAVEVRRADPQFASRPLAEMIETDDPILAEDAWVELSRGRLPTVMDPYAVARLSASRPELTEPLVRRVEAREFAYLVLLQRLDNTKVSGRYRWEDRAFGPAVVAAMRRNYRFLAERDGYLIYVRVDSGKE
jgi:hypothetical protein